MASTVGSARCWVRWNSQHSKKCVSLSPPVENVKDKKVKKSSVPELPRVVSVSSVLRIPIHVNVLYISIFYASIYLYISHIRIWLCYNLRSRGKQRLKKKKKKKKKKTE